VWKLDRFARSLRELIVLVNELCVEFVFLSESINTTTPGGKLVFHVFGAVAELERDLILETTMVVLEAAGARQEGRTPASGSRTEDRTGLQAHAWQGGAVCATVGV
jgi:DNA invertase Pin-like site-specific DNA recombinase